MALRLVGKFSESSSLLTSSSSNYWLCSKTAQFCQPLTAAGPDSTDAAAVVNTADFVWLVEVSPDQPEDDTILSGARWCARLATCVDSQVRFLAPRDVQSSDASYLDIMPEADTMPDNFYIAFYREQDPHVTRVLS